MTAIDAVKELADLGYRFEVVGSKLRYQFVGSGNPDPELVMPLLEVVKTNREKVWELIIRSKAEADPKPYSDDPNRICVQRETLDNCDCGAPAWDTDADGKEKCWSCLAIPGLFGKH